VFCFYFVASFSLVCYCFEISVFDWEREVRRFLGAFYAEIFHNCFACLDVSGVWGHFGQKYIAALTTQCDTKESNVDI
jgi:hypothetical protein